MSTILVVDDSPVDRLVAERLILKNIPDARVLRASGGTEALGLLEAESVDLVLTDLNMSGMDGLQLVEAIRELYPQTPVILMTGFGNESISVRALAAGAASYVSKRGMPIELASTVNNVIALAHTDQTRHRLLSSQIRTATTFVIDNDPGLVQPLVTHVQDQIVLIQSEDVRDVTRIGVALAEALLNAIYHGNLEVSSDLRQDDESIFHLVVAERRRQEPYRSRRVHVKIDISPEEVRLSIRDEGPGFDAKAALDPSRKIDMERVGGRGLVLIGSFLDVVYHNAKGNEIHLIKYFGNDSKATSLVPGIKKPHESSKLRKTSALE